MKRSLNKTFSKAISFLLAFVLMVGAAPLAVFANTARDDDKTITYVSIGDSMTNGYGMDGYDGESGVVNYANNTYANQFAAWLAGYKGPIADDQVIFEGTNGIVDHRQLAMSGLRAEDLLWILSLNYEDVALMETIYEKWGADWTNEVKGLWYGDWGFKTGDFRTWTDFCDWDYRYADAAARILANYNGIPDNGAYFQSSFADATAVQNATNGIAGNKYFPENKDEAALIGGYEYLQIATEFYQKSVEDADIISLALGNTNFGTYMLTEIMEVSMSNDLNRFPSRYDIEDVFNLANLDAKTESTIRDLIDQYDGIIDELFAGLAAGDAEKAEAVRNIIIYCVASYAVNYIGAVQQILAVNPDVKIIQVALMNAYADESAEIEGVTLGDMVDILYTPINAFLAAVPTVIQATGHYKDATFYYAEADSVECLVAVFGDDFYMTADSAEGEDGYVKYPGLLNGNSTENYIANINSTVRDRFVANIVRGDTFEMINKLGSAFKLSVYNTITVEDIAKYDLASGANKIETIVGDRTEAISYALYLAFERATIEAGKGTVTMDSLAALSDLEEAFGGLLSGGTVGTTATAYGWTTYSDDVANAVWDMVKINNPVYADYLTVDIIKDWYVNNTSNQILDANPALREAADGMCYVLGLPKALSDAMLGNSTISGILCMNARVNIGTGIGGHPSEAGHDAVYEAVKFAYEDGFTAGDKTAENLEFVAKELYNYLLENGYFEMAKEELIKYATTVADEVTAILEEELKPTAVALQKDLVALKGELAAKLNELNATLIDLTNKQTVILADMLEERAALVNELKNLEAQLNAIANGGSSVAARSAFANNTTRTTADARDELVADLKAAIAETKAAIAELDATIAYVKNQIETDKSGIEAIKVAIADVKANLAATEAALAEVNAAIEKLTADVAELKAAMRVLADAADALYDLTLGKVVDPEEVVDAVITIIEKLPEIIETAQNVYNKLVDTAEKAKVAVEAIKAFATVIEGHVQNIVDSAEDMIAIEGEKFEAIKETAGEIVEMVSDFVETNLPKVETALKNTATELKAYAMVKVDAVMALYAEHEEVIMAAASVAYWYCEQKGYIECAEKLICEYTTCICEKLTELEGKLAEAEELLCNKMVEAEAWLKVELADLKAELATLKEELKATADAKEQEVIEAAIAKIEVAIDEVEAKIEEAKAVIAEIKAYIATVKAAIADVKTALNNVEDAAIVVGEDIVALWNALCNLKGALCDLTVSVDGLYDAVVDEAVKLLGYCGMITDKVVAVVETVDGYVDLIDDALNVAVLYLEEAYYNATHADYEVNKDSYYVAIGDDTAVSEGYVDLLAQALGIAYNNLAEAGMTVEDVAALLNKNVAEIKKADLITVGFGNTSFITNTVNQVLSGNAAPEYDWEALVGAEAAEYVEQALAELKASFENAGMDGTEMGIEDLPATMTAAVEAYVYSCVVYAVGMPEIVTAIHAINPEALVIIIGMYNPMAEVVIDLGTTTVEIGEYVNYLVGAARLESLLYAMITGNAIYVDAPAVDTNLTDTELNVLDLMREFVQQMGANLDPSEEGHAYICEQIMNALNVTKAGLLGDANGDGEVNSIDALYVKKYDAEMMDETGLDLSVSDVNGDGAVNSVDALLIQRFDAELIDAFPVEMK